MSAHTDLRLVAKARRYDLQELIRKQGPITIERLGTFAANHHIRVSTAMNDMNKIGASLAPSPPTPPIAQIYPRPIWWPITQLRILEPKSTGVIYIYALCEPITAHVRYVGQSMQPLLRVIQHGKTRDTIDTAVKNQWVRAIREKGGEPWLLIIEPVKPEYAALRESYWINQYKEQGADLLNYTFNR